MRCVFETAGGSALGVALWVFTNSPVPLPRHLWLPALIAIGLGIVVGLVFGSLVRWGYETYLNSVDHPGCRDSERTSPRKWYQLSLQKLLLLFTLLAIVLGTVGLRALHLRWQSVAIANLQSAGGVFGYRGAWVFNCGLVGPAFGNAQLKQLRGLPRVEILNLKGSNVTDAGLEELAELQHLRVLLLDGTRITDNGVEYLKRVSPLEELSLGKTNVTQKGIKRFQIAMPNCNVHQ